jgi:hypothetical protein
MNAKDLFTALCAFTSVIRTPVEGEQRTFIVMEFAETDEHIGGGVYVVDPAIPATCNGSDLLQMSTARHAAMTIQDDLHDLTKKHMDDVGNIRNQTKALGMDNVLDALKNADNLEEFKAALKKNVQGSDGGQKFIKDALKRIMSGPDLSN